MRTLRFLCTADWHADNDEKKKLKLENSLKQILEYCKEVRVNAIIHAGDVWEKSQKYQHNSAVPIVLKYLKELSQYVDFIFITKGNNSHDEPGSISLLHQIEENIYAYEYPVVLGAAGLLDDSDCITIYDLLRDTPDKMIEEIGFIVSLVPYPTKSSFISEDSIDNNNVQFIEKFEQVFELIGDKTSEYSCPKILAFHGNVIGSRLSSGQTLISQDIMVAPNTLEKAKADYYALGHIHLRQGISPWMIYSGSIYNKNWGETEQKSFEVIEYLEREFTVETIPLTSARPMIKLEAEFDAGLGFITKADFSDKDNYDNPKNSEIRYRVTVRENDRNLITDEKISELKKYFTDLGNEIKLEFNIIPSERESRSEQIMHCKNIVEEVVEYAAVVDEPVTESIKEKAASLVEREVIV